MNFQAELTARRVSDEGLGFVHDGALVYLNGASGFPNRFAQRLAAEGRRFRDVQLFHPMRREVLPLTPDLVSADLAGHLFHVSDFTYDENVRTAIREGRASYRPNHGSESGRRFPYDIDVFVAGATPMDEHGYFNLGSWGGWVPDFLPRVKKLVLEVNPAQPRVHGDVNVHISQVAGFYEADYPLVELPQAGAAPSETEKRIATHIAALIEDGSTLQVGAGNLPEAVVQLLVTGGAKDLGVHTEAYFDWVVRLTEAGVITNARKSLDRGRMMAAMAIGSSRLHRFVDRNPFAWFRAFSYVNDVRTIAAGYRPVSINATLEVDLMGQCASEGFGHLHHSGVGGQWNFHYGAALADEGKGIIALSSTARGGTVSRIVPMLAAGTAVTIPRNDIHWVVTEYGAVDLRGKSLRDRARLLISIAHPQFRESLERAARNEMHLLPGTA
ncbi:acetyl-CoA hydrolase/transferase family protein [Variovorax sp. PBL-E5]|uniref:acetyl-CoA hydrolase/transferase family protein n=1 Tax=Variovorax sp. PBL-E5 TaxID=434014 RepID=UPI001315B603|nr:acetyl-CoA hydrolase/transferase family protein [Variovorax sp. PBL-E5]VTU22980.1 Succinyl-CoA:coenzyme A transferase [Variovorax sp. PBL-E5]